MIHQLRALGHHAEWRPNNDQLVTGPDAVNVMVEGFTPSSIQWMKHYHDQGARFLILATEEPTDKGFNHGLDQEMRQRQRNFPEAAKFAEAIWYLVPGDYTHKWYSQWLPSHYVELGYAPTLVRIDNRIEPEYEFGFYGSLTRRRIQVLRRLAKKTRAEKAVRLMGDFKTQQERDNVMRQAKVIILVRKFDKMGLVSSSRCNTALSIGRPVIGEPHALAEEWEGIVRFAPNIDAFYNEALLYKAAWKGLHASQFDRFKHKLTPELCVGRAFNATNLRERVRDGHMGMNKTDMVFDINEPLGETVSGASDAGDRPDKADDANQEGRSLAA
jgi:hypothetical protein